MPLISIGNELSRAQAGGYALPLFDTFDMHSAEGMFLAIEDRRAPAMVAIYAPFIEQPEARAFCQYLRTRAEGSPSPVSIMLDHGSSLELCVKALRFGLTDVMYDGSHLSLDENISNTRQVVRAAHAVGACIEAELGHVGSGSEYQSYGAKRSGFTSPDQVERFVAETGVDMLAVAVGTAHGEYQGEPALDLELLKEIRRRVDIPLALHGGSGLSAEQFQAAIAAGIAKVNVATDLYLHASQQMLKVACDPKTSYFYLTKVAVTAFQDRCAYYLDLFGASGKAHR